MPTQYLQLWKTLLLWSRKLYLDFADLGKFTALPTILVITSDLLGIAEVAGGDYMIIDPSSDPFSERVRPAGRPPRRLIHRDQNAHRRVQGGLLRSSRYRESR